MRTPISSNLDAESLSGVLLDTSAYTQDDVDLSPLTAQLPAWRHFKTTPDDEAALRVGDAAVVVVSKVTLAADTLARCPNLRLILMAATGYDNIDLEACQAQGIAVANARNYATEAVAQHSIAMMLALLTQLPAYQADIRAGRWSTKAGGGFSLFNRTIRELADMRVGIVGRGAIGRRVAALLEAFGASVQFAARPGGVAEAGRVPLAELLPSIDILSLHCPLNPHTRHLINRDALHKMRRDALIINVARGAVVDSAALAQALRAGDIGGAGIDVLEQEPPPPDHPLLQIDAPNCIITPHNSWASLTTRRRLIEDMAANLKAWREGKPRNRVV